MKIFRIEIENFRLLKKFSIDLEKDLSLVIGKNNTGKTSILSALEKFLAHSDKNRFTFEDFNIDFQKYIKDRIEAVVSPSNEEDEVATIESTENLSISLRLFIEYNEHDNLANVSNVMMDLDPDNNVVVLGFYYSLNFTDLIRMRNDFNEFSVKEKRKSLENSDYTPRTLLEFLKSNHPKYFRFERRSLAFDQLSKKAIEETFIDLDKEKISISNIISFKYISARREVTNKEIDKTLSGQTSRIYKRSETNEEQNQAIENFKDQLTLTDVQLTGIYRNLFHDVVEKVKEFGGVKVNESEIEIISTLQHRELLEGNTTVVYKHDQDARLPEHYNGLGYLNLISMIFEIEILVHEFKRTKDEKPADINLLFIEEPEAHTHPQMQYVFIKNIKKLLKDGIKRDDGENRTLQYVITTHSAHIVADCDFDSVKYLAKTTINEVVAKNLKDLKKEYEEDDGHYKFLKQYLTISRAEIFFAEKAVLIEGDTERILIPTIMQKIDFEERKRYSSSSEQDPFLPLLSQNISIIEVGAYSNIFEKFISFLEIKCLIITDIDAVNDKNEQCKVSEGVKYSNPSLKYFYKEVDRATNQPSDTSRPLSEITTLSLEQKIFKKEGRYWISNHDGNLCVTYQTEEAGYYARSFEDSFIHINREFIVSNLSGFKSLKKVDLFKSTTCAFELANGCVDKKTHFALDILFNSDTESSNWSIPNYIREGLLWLKAD